MNGSEFVLDIKTNLRILKTNNLRPTINEIGFEIGKALVRNGISGESGIEYDKFIKGLQDGMRKAMEANESD